MYTLYYSPGTAALAVHLALIEIGAPHELREVDLEAGEQKSAAYRALNPNGVVPTLIVDGRPVAESAALLLLLGERHPECAARTGGGFWRPAGVSAMDAAFREYAAANVPRLVHAEGVQRRCARGREGTRAPAHRARVGTLCRTHRGARSVCDRRAISASPTSTR